MDASLQQGIIMHMSFDLDSKVEFTSELAKLLQVEHACMQATTASFNCISMPSTHPFSTIILLASIAWIY